MNDACHPGDGPSPLLSSSGDSLSSPLPPGRDSMSPEAPPPHGWRMILLGEPDTLDILHQAGPPAALLRKTKEALFAV